MTDTDRIEHRRKHLSALVAQEHHNRNAHVVLSAVSDPEGIAMIREARNAKWAHAPVDMCQISEDPPAKPTLRADASDLFAGFVVAIGISVLIWGGIGALAWDRTPPDAVEVEQPGTHALHMETTHE